MRGDVSGNNKTSSRPNDGERQKDKRVYLHRAFADPEGNTYYYDAIGKNGATTPFPVPRDCTGVTDK